MWNKVKSDSFWSYQFNQKYGVSQFLAAEKQKILDQYLNVKMPQLFQGRVEAAFGNQLDIQQIDNFMSGANGNSGYISQLQTFFNEYYNESFRNAQEIFSSKLNSVLAAKTKNGFVSMTNLKLNSDQAAELNRLLEAQDNLLEYMSVLSSLAEPYILSTASAHKIKGGAFSLKSLKNGTYRKESFDADGKRALEMWEKIKSVQAELGTNAAVVNGDLKQSFKCFRETADKFHALYGEYLLTIASYYVGKKMGETEQALANIGHTGSMTYQVGFGTIEMRIRNDPALEASLKSNGFDGSQFGSFTAKDDTRIAATANGVTGVFGGSVKEYSDKSVTKFGGWTNIDTYANIYTAASLATQYGLPFTYATSEFIDNLGGALYGTYGPGGVSHQWWNEYLELLSQLLFLDALMGRTANGTISKGANSIIFVKNGQVYYLGEIIKNITTKSMQGSSRGLWASNLQNIEHFDRSSIEEAHYQIFKSGGSQSEAEMAVRAAVQKVKLAIRINLNNLISNW